MSIEDPKEYNRQRKIDKFEKKMDKVVKRVSTQLSIHWIMSTNKQDYEIAEIIYNNDVDLSDIDLDKIDNADDVLFELRELI